MSYSYSNAARLIPGTFGALILLLCVSLPVQSQPAENGDIVVLLADFEGPDPEGIPVKESLFSWLQQVGSEEAILRILLMDEVIEFYPENSETAFERGLDAGADLVLWGIYDLPGTRARITIAVTSCTGSITGTVTEILFDLEDSFPLSELIPGSEPPERIRSLSYFLAGFTYLSRDNFEQGLVYLNKALDYEDSAPVGIIATAYSLRSFINLQWRNDVLTALSDANRAIDMDTENPIHYTYRGICYEMMGESQAALEDYLTVKELDPSDPENLYNISRLYQELGDYYRAIDAINLAIFLVPSDACYLNERGYIYNHMGEYQAAADDISKSLELNPEYPTGWANLGCAERELGNLTEAIRCFSNAIEYQTDPALISSYMRNRGTTSALLHDYRSAISDYTSALDLYPGTAFNYSYLGCLLFQVEDYEDAIVYYDMALQMDRDNPDNLCNRGLCNYHIGETAAAIEDLTAAMELDPDRFTPYKTLGRAYTEEGDFVSAIGSFSNGLDTELDPVDCSWLLSDRAWCYRLAGDLESSLADLDEAIKQDPSEPYFHFRKGEVYYLMNLYSLCGKAIESYNNAIELGLSEEYLPGCLFQRGRIYIDLENYEIAVQDLTAALESDPNYFDAYFFRGLAYYQNGEFDMCREDMERFLQVGTDPEFTASAREIMRSME